MNSSNSLLFGLVALIGGFFYVLWDNVKAILGIKEYRGKRELIRLFALLPLLIVGGVFGGMLCTAIWLFIKWVFGIQ